MTGGETLILDSTGAGLVMLTEAEALRAPLEAITVNGPPAKDPAVNKPLLLIEPPPETFQENAGRTASTAPN